MQLLNETAAFDAQVANYWLSFKYGILVLGLPTLACTIVIVGSIAFALAFIRPRVGLAQSVPFVTAFAMIGSVAGVIAGASMEAIVGGILTAILGIVSSLLTWLFGKETLRIWRPVIPWALIALLMSTLTGLIVGGARRAQIIASDIAQEQAKFENQNIYGPVELERRRAIMKKCIEERDARQAAADC